MGAAHSERSGNQQSAAGSDHGFYRAGCSGSPRPTLLMWTICRLLVLMLFFKPAVPVGTLVDLQAAIKANAGPITLTQPISIDTPASLAAIKPIQLRCSEEFDYAAGAAISISVATVSLSNLQFTGCQGTLISVTTGAQVDLKNVRILNNSAPINTGLLYVEDASLTMSACHLDGNSCPGCSLVWAHAVAESTKLIITDKSVLEDNRVRNLVRMLDSRPVKINPASPAVWSDVDLRAVFLNNTFRRHFTQEPTLGLFNNVQLTGSVQISNNVLTGPMFNISRTSVEIANTNFASNNGSSDMLILAESRMLFSNCKLFENVFLNGTFMGITNHWGIHALEGVVFEKNKATKMIDVMGSTLFKNLMAYQDARFAEEVARTARLISVDGADYQSKSHIIAKCVQDKDRSKQATPLYLSRVDFMNCSIASSLLFINGSDPQNIRRVASDWKENSTLLHMVDVNFKNCSVDAKAPGPDAPAKALFVMQNFNGTMIRVTMDGNAAPDLINVNSNTFMMFNSTLRDNRATTNYRSALWRQKWAYNHLKNVTFQGNSNFTNIASVIQATERIEDCKFMDNVLNDSDNATAILRLESGDGTVNRTWFEGNQAHSIALADTVAVTVEACNFTRNKGTSLKMVAGESIYVEFVTTVKGCQFDSNNGTDGTLALTTGDFHVIDSNFSSNWAVRGGAIFSTTTDTQVRTEPRVHIMGCSIQNNTALRHGGGLWIGDATNIRTTSILNNTANGTGGGVYVYNTSLFMGSATKVSNNKAASGGGITALQATNLTLTNMSIVDNLAAQSLAGMSRICEGLGPVDSCSMFYDVPCRRGGGGALCVVHGKAAVEDTLVNGNTASYGGAFHVDCAMQQDNCKLQLGKNITFEGNALQTELPGTGVVLMMSTPQDVCCRDGEICVAYGKAGWDKCHDVFGSAAELSALPANQRNVASLPKEMRQEIIQPAPPDPLRPGSQVSMNLTMVGHFGESIESMPMPIMVTVQIQPGDAEMLLVGYTSMGLPFTSPFTFPFTFPSVVFRHLTINRATTSLNSSVYALAFNASSPQLQGNITDVSWNFTIRGCTLGEFANQYRCDSCSELQRKQFSMNTAIRCEPCPATGFCGESSAGLLLPKPGVFQTSALLPQLTRCPVPEACGKGDTLSEAARQGALETLVQRLSNDYSSGALTWEGAMELDKQFKAQQCAEGYTGLLCGTCQEGYGRFFNKCNKCLGPGLNAVIILLFILLLFVIIGVTIFGHIRTVSQALQKAQMANHRQQGFAVGSTGAAQQVAASVKEELHELTALTAVFKVFVTYAQSVSMIRGMTLRVPRSLQSIFAGIDFTSAAVSWVSLDCSTKERGWTSAALRVPAPLLVPISCVTAAAIFWTIVLVFKIKAGEQGLRKYVRDRMTMTTVQIAFFLYPAITTAVFTIFNCYKISGPITATELDYYGQTVLGNNVSALWIKELRWMQDFDTQCWKGRHFTLALSVGIPGIFVYVLGIPFGFACLLWRKRNHIGEPRTIMTMGFLYDGYQDKFFWWELVIMGRKLLLLICSLLISSSNSSSSYVQLCLCTLVVVCSLLLQQWCSPHSKPFLNGLETIALFGVNVTFILLGVFVISDNVSNAALIFALVTTILINAAIIIVFLWFMAHLAVSWLQLQLGDNPHSYLKKFIPGWGANWKQNAGGHTVNAPGRNHTARSGLSWHESGRQSSDKQDLLPTDGDSDQNGQTVVAVVPAPPGHTVCRDQHTMLPVHGAIQPANVINVDVQRGEQQRHGDETGASGQRDVAYNTGYGQYGRTATAGTLNYSSTGSLNSRGFEYVLPHQGGGYGVAADRSTLGASHDSLASVSDSLTHGLRHL